MSQNTHSSPSSLNGHAPQGQITPIIAPHSVPANGANAVQTGPNQAGNEQRAVTPSLEQRVAAQAQAPDPAARGVGNLNDPIARPRDKDGLPTTRPQVYLTPGLLSGRPLAETNLAGLLKIVAEQFPARAERTAMRYEDGVRFNKQQFDDADRLEREELERNNAEIERRNAALEENQAGLEVERDARCADDRAAQRALDPRIAEAHQQAAVAVARTGGDYDPNNPTAECVLREQPLPLEVVTGGALPWTPGDDAKRVPEWVQWVLKLGVGMAIGFSIGFVTRLIAPDQLGSRPMELIVCLFLGFVVAVGGGMAVRSTTRRASERYWMARFGSYSPTFWIPSLLFAAGIGLLLIGAEATIETVGLLTPVLLDLQNGGTMHVPMAAFYLIGLIFTIGYLVTLACEGALDGRFDVCLNRAKAMQHEEFKGRAQAERENEQVQVALEKLGLVRELLRQWQGLEDRIAATAAPFDQKIEMLEQLKKTPEQSLSSDARERLRDYYDNLAGSNGELHADIDELLNVIEPLPTRQRVRSSAREQGSQAKPGLWRRIANWWRRR